MVNSDVKLVPIKRKFSSTPRGKYPRLIRQFLASGEAEIGVTAENMELAYLGLRSAVSNMGLKGRVYVQRQDGEVHLIRQQG